MLPRDIYSREEKEAVKKAIKTFNGQVTSVTKIANVAGMNANRVRFIIDFMEQDCEIVKVPEKMFNAKYIRYSYQVIDEGEN